MPTAAALAAPGITYAVGPPPSPGSQGDVLGAVLLSTPRTSPPSTSGQQQRGHTDSPMLNYIYDARSNAHKHMHHSQRFGPLFENNATNITVQIGNAATIDCKISLLQDNAVSCVCVVRRGAQLREACRRKSCCVLRLSDCESVWNEKKNNRPEGASLHFHIYADGTGLKGAEG